MSSSNDSKQRITAIAAVVGILLLGAIAFLLYSNANKSQALKAQTVELDEANKVKVELEKNYYQTLSELEEMKGDNEELNALIESQKEEVKAQKSKIDRLINTGRGNKRDLDAAIQQIDEMQGQRDRYLAEIEGLKAQNASLTEANTSLTTQRNSLQEEVASERSNAANLSEEKAVLVSQKETLEGTNADLSRKVTRGSVIDVTNVHATGFKIKKSGKESKKKRARNIDQLKICFSTSVNELAVPGDESFIVRLINPVGETIAVESKGSGVFRSTKSNEEIRYTQIKNINYEQTEKAYCFMWAQDSFQKGIHEIEVYNKGYLAGKGNVELK